MKNRKISFYDDVYRYEWIFVFGDNDYLRQVLKRDKRFDETYVERELSSDTSGLTLQYRENAVIVVKIKNYRQTPFWIGILVHEILHGVIDIFDHRHIVYDVKSDEHFVYYVESILERILDKVKTCKTRKK